MAMFFRIFTTLLFIFISFACSSNSDIESTDKIRIILDTDANNELDDQHAIAYMLLNEDVFHIEGITVNRTKHGGGIEKHYEEAERIIKLCGMESQVQIYTGADKSFDEIREDIENDEFDGHEAVNFIINRAKQKSNQKLVLMPVGKLTNIALALIKAPEIASQVRIVWLGSNYPDPGEYNQINDVSALQYMLDLDLDFEIALVRGGKPSGTAAVTVTREDINKNMNGKGPQISTPVIGRHGGEFINFGDYSVSLFENCQLFGDPPSRSLFDMAAVAIVKNPTWAERQEIPTPDLVDGKWIDRPNNENRTIIWVNFNRELILKDFYDSFN